MNEETRLHVSTAIGGLEYSGRQISEALGYHPTSYKEEKIHRGPFAQALNRVAEIADGAPLEERLQAEQDMLFLFDLLHLLAGGFYSTLQNILERAHSRIAEPITTEEASAILKCTHFLLDINVRIGRLHPLPDEEGTCFYARYEVGALKAREDESKRRMAQFRDERKAK